ncbi:hypothetical protein C8R43DRAFT_1127022 [Mycena crocata]|nr:hypothetical protein C8R43DRAFT_1127022 [Mycena crocata]
MAERDTPLENFTDADAYLFENTKDTFYSSREAFDEARELTRRRRTVDPAVVPVPQVPSPAVPSPAPDMAPPPAADPRPTSLRQHVMQPGSLVMSRSSAPSPADLQGLSHAALVSLVLLSYGSQFLVSLSLNSLPSLQMMSRHSVWI